MALPKYLMLGKPKYKVKNIALKTKSIITNGAPEKTSKKIILKLSLEKVEKLYQFSDLNQYH